MLLSRSIDVEYRRSPGTQWLKHFGHAASLLCLLAVMPAYPADHGNLPFSVEIVADMKEPWAMAVIDEGLLLVTEKPGSLKLVTSDGTIRAVTGVPEVAYGGQGGLGDIVLAPDFAETGQVYLSFVEEEEFTLGAVVARGILEYDDTGGTLSDLEIIWRQAPKVTGQGHYGHRIAFGPEGKLWISSGERQKFDPAQDMAGNLGKLVRLNLDGSIPDDNPYADQGGVTAEIWSAGHRNPLGLAFDDTGQLWLLEMGPAHGDELNRVVRGANYGYPIVSNGDHYDGRDIPHHDTQPQFEAPTLYWVPAISPSNLIFYRGDTFKDWNGNALITGLGSKGLVRIEFDGDTAREADRYPLDARIRSIAQAPDGTLWVLEDERRGSKGRLLRLRPTAN